MQPLATGLSYVDLDFLGRPHAIATVVVQGAGGVALIDPGPTTCLDESRASVCSDQASVSQTSPHPADAHPPRSRWRDRNDRPQASGFQVMVHERGAPHLHRARALVDSARRLWGADMDRLWGEVLPVPERNLHVVDGSERGPAGGRTFEVAYTPGHASHHVSYFDPSSGIAFVGDTAGVSYRRRLRAAADAAARHRCGVVARQRGADRAVGVRPRCS